MGGTDHVTPLSMLACVYENPSTWPVYLAPIIVVFHSDPPKQIAHLAPKETMQVRPDFVWLFRTKSVTLCATGLEKGSSLLSVT